MPSPFPGMDPYLEGALWTSFHFTFGAEIVRQLAPWLRPRYLVLSVERFVMEPSDDIATYDLLGYDLAIHYSHSPEPPLNDQASALADSLLSPAGLRPA